ncbi:DUF3592 domain-containing protein [Kribbella lupini]|uniref:DUF3592 domain-containing protein n=1 Tax=Kribbella lupini TaxID=291602 RepID=A0ABP4L4D2_9ACTN
MRRSLGDFRAPVRLIGCLVAAVVALGIGANAVVELARLDARGVRVTATVLDVPSPLSRGPGSFTAEYAIAGGERITTEISRYDVLPEIGGQVEIVYDPAEPTVAKTADAWVSPWEPGIAYGLGAGVLVWVALGRQSKAA